MSNKKKAAPTPNGSDGPNTESKYTSKIVNNKIPGEFLYSTSTGEVMIVSETVNLYAVVPSYSLKYLPSFVNVLSQKIGIDRIAETSGNLLEYADSDNVTYQKPKDYAITPKQWGDIPYEVKQVWAELIYKISIAAKMRFTAPAQLN